MRKFGYWAGEHQAREPWKEIPVGTIKPACVCVWKTKHVFTSHFYNHLSMERSQELEEFTRHYTHKAPWYLISIAKRAKDFWTRKQLLFFRVFPKIPQPLYLEGFDNFCLTCFADHKNQTVEKPMIKGFLMMNLDTKQVTLHKIRIHRTSDFALK